MRTRGFLGALVVPLLLLSACGEQTSESASDPSPATSSSSAAAPPGSAATSPSSTPKPEGPACTAVWKNGATLPRDYSGCVAGERAVEPSDRFCEFGKKLVIFDDRFYAVRTGTIHRTDGPLDKDPGYRSAMASCMA